MVHVVEQEAPEPEQVYDLAFAGGTFPQLIEYCSKCNVGECVSQDLRTHLEASMKALNIECVPSYLFNLTAYLTSCIQPAGNVVLARP